MSLQLPQLNAHFIFNAYLYHISPTCFGVISHHLQGELSIPYSKPSAFTKLLSAVHWLHHKI